MTDFSSSELTWDAGPVAGDLVVGTLITDAELLAYPYITFPPVPRPALLRALGSMDAELVRLIVAEVPHALSFMATAVVIASASNATGYTLVKGFQLQQLTYEDKDGVLTPIDIVTLSRLDDASATHPAGVIVNQTTFLPVDPLGKRWAGSESRGWYVGDGDKILGRRAVAPISPGALTDTLTSPVTARDYFLHALRLFILLQHPSVPEDVIATARDRVPQERLAVLTQAHKMVEINSRFGEKDVGTGVSLRRRILQ